MKSENSQKETKKTQTIEITVEELERKIAPGITRNHNETLVRDADMKLEIEELEEKIAPGRGMNHNETLVRDASE